LRATYVYDEDHRDALETYTRRYKSASRGFAKLFTVDERHFRAVRNSKGLPFTLLSADARH
jgi:hypothetical protein